MAVKTKDNRHIYIYTHNVLYFAIIIFILEYFEFYGEILILQNMQLKKHFLFYFK